ncbi:MAG: ABC transporter substrate-binding protein [Alphaproteobacteria bacterium]|nr:ABC transporter substrate-binding protein [Alphaproteobacteria bacterium]MBV8412216.1 ABC transporter substrate-binding protein [Alphaproteobacteria bacterium]
MPLFAPRRNMLRLAVRGAAVALVGTALAVESRTAAAEQNSAAELIQQTAAQVLDLVMTKTGAAREAGILRILETYFDLNYMVRSSLGIHWNQATPEQRERFLKAAASAEAHAYARRFGQYGGQTLTVARAAPVTRGDGVSIVNSKLTQTDAEPIAIQWDVRNGGQGVRIVDVRIEGVSMVVTRRAEFNSFIQAHGGKVEPLIDELEARSKR